MEIVLNNLLSALWTRGVICMWVCVGECIDYSCIRVMLRSTNDREFLVQLFMFVNAKYILYFRTFRMPLYYIDGIIHVFKFSIVHGKHISSKKNFCSNIFLVGLTRISVVFSNFP